MTERMFSVDGFTGTQFAAGLDKPPALQIDTPGGASFPVTRDEAEALGLALLRWSSPTHADKGELYFQDYRKSFQLSTDCPRCGFTFSLLTLEKRTW